jgi:hypothetical protein
MRFVIGFAGIPLEVYDQVYKKRESIVRENGDFFGKPLKEGYAWYDSEYAQVFLQHFFGLITNDHHSALQDTGFALICVTHDKENTKNFAKKFFPSILVLEVDWTLA